MTSAVRMCAQPQPRRAPILYPQVTSTGGEKNGLRPFTTSELSCRCLGAVRADETGGEGGEAPAAGHPGDTLPNSPPWPVVVVPAADRAAAAAAPCPGGVPAAMAAAAVTAAGREAARRPPPSGTSGEGVSGRRMVLRPCPSGCRPRLCSHLFRCSQAGGRGGAGGGGAGRGRRLGAMRPRADASGRTRVLGDSQKSMCGSGCWQARPSIKTLQQGAGALALGIRGVLNCAGTKAPRALLPSQPGVA